MKKNLFLCVLVISLLGPGAGTLAHPGSKKGTPAAAAPRYGNVEAITSDQLRDYLYFIASDELEGRDTPSRGLDTAAKFIALNLARWGLKPSGDNGTYFQRIALRRTTVDPARTHAEMGDRTFVFGDDYLPSIASSAAGAGTASGPLVYVGHGWVIKSKKIDAYEGLDVKGKIVIIAGGGLPKGATFKDLQGKQGEDWDSPRRSAQQRGAAGTISVADFQSLVNWDHNRRDSIEQGIISVEKFETEPQPMIPSIIVSPKMLAALFQGEKQKASEIFKHTAGDDPLPRFALNPNKRFSFTVATRIEQVETQNVLAVLEGSDPSLKREYVAIGAHYDHVGIGTPVNGDAIYNGADDDGSGTVSVLAIAEAFAHGPRPKRSILFIWHAGEEKGLWGSQYFTEYPTVPLNQIITQLNIDMIGRRKMEGDTNPANIELPGPNEVYLVGSKKLSTDLGELSERVNRSYLNLGFNYKYDAPDDPNHFFFRSDHFNYARKGIPIIFYMDGSHEDYHKPSDSVEKIDYLYMQKVARTIFATAWELANQTARPRVDKKLPSELTDN